MSGVATSWRTSVVVPAHNSAQTLSRTLDSLLAQSDGDWQALVVDDNSSDDTPSIVAAYAGRDPRFIALQGGGAGASAARNVGLAQAHGRRLLFLDSDDWIDPDFLETMNAAIDATPGAVAAYCGYRRVMPDGGMSPARHAPHIAAAPFEAFARSCATAIHTIVIERVVVERLGGFDPALRTCEDWDLWQRAARLGGSWVQVPLALSYYRTTTHSLTHDVECMVADARTVIGRGFAADDRLVEVAAEHAAGASSADGRTAAVAHAYFALWCAAFDCGRGGTGTAVREPLAALSPAVDSAKAIVDVLFDGAMVGCRAVPARLAARWPEFGVAVTTLISRLGAHWNDTVAARRIQYRFERLLLDYDDLSAPRPLALTLGLRVDLRSPAPLAPPPGIDRLYVYLCDGDEVCALLDVGVLGTVSRRQWLELAIAQLGFRRVARCAAPALLQSFEPAALARLVPALRRAPRRAGIRGVAAHAARIALLEAAGPGHTEGSHRQCLDSLVDAAGGSAARHGRQHRREALTDPSKPSAAATPSVDARHRHAYWERLFEQPDPWNYGSAYEAEKYERQLRLLGDRPIARALELACAEGHFTARLAPRVGHLIAADISSTALGRARQRCAAYSNVAYRQLDLRTDALPQALDLIVCSEVLYYLDDEAELAQVAKRLTAALSPGGRLLSAHAFVLRDDPTRTGFDWDTRWGGRTILRVLAGTPGLALERSLHTELYGIEVFLRVDDAAAAPQPVLEDARLDAPMELEVARHIVWGGAAARRAELAGTERHAQMPVLSYHRIAAEGPAALARYRTSPSMFEAQMRWLRGNGYHSISCGQLHWFITHQHPFPGRPVLITFDDGYQDVADAAWPILRRHDFACEVFVVTDLVGQQALWDVDAGEPAALMDAATVVRLASEGVAFGSHLASHRAGDGLTTRELVEELARSRAVLSCWLDRSIETLAAPFGLIDERLRRLAADCGFRVAFGGEDGAVQVGWDSLNLPRIEVRGDWTLSDFIARLQACR